MTTKDSLSQSMDSAVKHYSSLFWLPSYQKVVLLLVLVWTSAGLFSAVVVSPLSEGLAVGLSLGFSLVFGNLILNYITSMVILRRNPIYDLRRTAALSLYCGILWFFFISVGGIIAVATHSDSTWFIRLSLMGFSAVTILRLVVISSTSFVGYGKLLLASFLQPICCIIPFLIAWQRIDYPIFLFLSSSLVLATASSFFFTFLLNRVGKQLLGVSALRPFKAFLLNWVANLNGPFEEFLEKIGESQDVEVSLIKYCSSKPKVIIAVPSVHPGPFKNVGSSLLPSMLKSALEKESNCVACVPHGLFGHEFDLASQLQNQKILGRIVEFANFKVFDSGATPFVMVTNGLASACCQVFGNSAFLSLTLAPETTEDLPEELGFFVRKEAEGLGLACCVVVNAHNSIDGKIDMNEALGSLKAVAAACLKKAASLKRSPFEIGAATVLPQEFSLREGMGPSGITVVVVKVEGQKTAYVVIDGNNMISGLRESIFSSLHSVGIDKNEVFTTDTHSVNAIILGDRGYHPIGEATNNEKLIGYIKEATSLALSSLEPVKVACHSTTITNIKVIGEKQLKTLCLLIDKTLQKAREVVVPIFASCGLLLMLISTYV